MKVNYSLPFPHRCLNPKACSGNITSNCTLGYTGFLCSGCVRGYYKIGQKCKACETSSIETILLSSASIAIIVLAIIIALNAANNRNNDQSGLSIFSSRVKICINFYCTLDNIYHVLSFVEWPSLILDISKYLRLLQFNPLSVVLFQCWMPGFGLYEQFNYMVAINLIMVCLTIFGMIIFHAISIHPRNNEKKFTWKLYSIRRGFVGIISLLLFVFYPATASSVFAILPSGCKKYYLTQDKSVYVHRFMEDPTTKCFNDLHNAKIPIAYAFLVYVVGLPLVTPLFLLYLNMTTYKKGTMHAAKLIDEINLIDFSQSGNEDVIAASYIRNPTVLAIDLKSGLRFYYENYKTHLFYWESMEMLRKLLLSSVCVFIGGFSKTTLALLIIFSGMFAFIHAQVKPIKNRFEHWLQMTSLFAIFSNLVIGVLMRLPTDDEYYLKRQDSFGLTILLLVCNGSLLFLLLG